MGTVHELRNENSPM